MGLRETLDIEVVDKSNGEARLSMKARDEHLNDGGILHGGAIATLADCAMGSALCSNLDEGQPVTVEAKVNYLEPGTEGVIIATARGTEVSDGGMSLGAKVATPAILAGVALALYAWVQGRQLDSIEERFVNADFIIERLIEHLQLTAASTVLV
ncbi:MAG: PaaI family thioesterase, partial [Actinobacteria bacterium]|nr:PaaI family thioesterase [Actinomycetota bacterium]